MSRLHPSRQVSKSKRRRASCRPFLEELEDRRVMSANVRSIDGTGNNLANPTWGSSNVALLRVGPASYDDGISTPVVGDPPRPSARVISNTVADQGDQDIISNRLMSAMVYAWGQFIDHDLDLTTTGTDSFDIAVPAGDPFFDDPANPGTQVIHFNRSLTVAGTGTSTSNPRQQPNLITAFLDASMVYGSSDFVASALRTHSGGLLKSSPGADGVAGTLDDLLPLNNHDYFPGISQDPADPDAAFKIANDSHIVADHELFMAGDVRANENIELTSLHTLFVREHNRLATQIHAANPSLSDEDVYQRARAIVIGEIEAITFNQWIPALLGPGAIPAYRGYNPNVNPGIATAFSTAAFRVGHTMLGNDVRFLNNNGLPVADDIALSQAFFNPPELTANGIAPILKYLSSDPASEVDNMVVGSVRNFLFGPPGAGGFDLASLNIQRGRDHGLEDYNSMRVAYHLAPVTSFAQITSNVTLQQKLQDLYGNVNNIDAWVGALAEDHVPGTSTGPLIRAALIDQFTRVRNGDRFWFERTFSGSQLSNLENTSLADLLRRDGGVRNLQDNVFFFRVAIFGTVFNDANRNGRRDFGEGGLAGRTMQLEDLAGNVLQTTTTNAIGQYVFNNFNGLETGQFRVREIVPPGWRATTSDPVAVSITGGEQFVRVNFGNARVFGTTTLAQLATMGATTASPAAASATPTDATAPQSASPAPTTSDSGSSPAAGSTTVAQIGASTPSSATSIDPLTALFALGVPELNDFMLGK